MSGRIDPDPGQLPNNGLAPANAGVLGLAAALPVSLDPDDRVGNYLPPDHPAWAKDAMSLSQRARALLARLRPIAIKVVTFWEHRIRSILVGGRTLSVDASGSYRLD